MSSVGQWEVVVNKSNRSKQINDGKINKGQKKKVDHMPKLDEVSPIKESHTIFKTFLEQGKKKESQSLKQNGISENKNKKVTQQKKKGQTKKSQQKLVTLDEAIEQLSISEVQSLLDEVQTRYPETPSIWLKDLASLLNVKLNVELNDVIFNNKSAGYPLCIISPAITDILVKTMNQCSNSVLKHFFEHCIHSMSQDMVKGQSTFGYRIFLQCLGKEKPDIIINSLSKCSDLRTSYQNRQNICLSILWAAGQAGMGDLNAGLKVWLELMLPLVGMRAYSKFTIDYLNDLLRSYPDATSCSDVLGVKELFPILDFVYTPSGLPGNLQKQLQNLYPRLKELSYGPNPETVLRNYFLSYLCRLQPSCSEGLRRQLLSSLVECLLHDKHCYSAWRQLYTKHLVQSSMLMKHLLEQWENLPSSFPQKLLKETLSTFRVTNDEFSAQTKTGQEGYIDCVKYCNELLAKMSAWKFPWRHFLILLFFGIGTFLIYDINLYGSFEKSRSGKFLKESGILNACEQARGRITSYSQKSIEWLNKNVPVYYAKACNICRPYLELFWENFFIFCTYVWDSTADIREWLIIKVPPILDWLSEHLPLYLEKIARFISEIWKILHHYILLLSGYTLYYLDIAGRWLQENVFKGNLSPENLQRYAVNAIEVIQQYTMSVLHWCNQQLSSIMSNK